MRPGSSLLSVPEIIVGILVSVLLILFSITGSFDGLLAVTSSVTDAIQSDSNSYFSAIRQDFEFITKLAEIRDQNDRLKEENIELTSENTELKNELSDLAKIMKQGSFNLKFDLEPARVIKYDDARAGEILINKGSEHNVQIGSIVVVENYALGEVIEASERFSRVRLVTSSESIVPVISPRTATRGILKGEFGVGTIMTQVLTESKIKAGDRVISSGVNSNYPHGLTIGTVQEVLSVESELTKEIKVSNNIEFNNLLEVFVIINK